MNDLKLLYDRRQLLKRVDELAVEISRDYLDRDLVVIGVLKGAFIFLADLIRRLTIPVQVDFVRLASYGAGMKSSGKVIITKDIETSLAGRNVLVVEDIVDTGHTMKFLLEWFSERQPESIKVCTLLDKPSRRKVKFQADYTGFAIDDLFVVGYGLDFDERYRFLPEVHVVCSSGKGDQNDRPLP
jgi:hypoxanthine phosphoribosyltransferase